MKTPQTDVDSLVEVLRGDFPNVDDEARIRARLLAAGVVVSIAATTTSSAAALTGASFGTASVAAVSAGATAAPSGLVKAGLLAKVLALPLAGKIGVATTVAVVVAASSVPMISKLQQSAAEPSAQSGLSVSRAGVAARARSPRAGAPSEVPAAAHVDTSLETSPAAEMVAAPPRPAALTGEAAALPSENVGVSAASQLTASTDSTLAATRAANGLRMPAQRAQPARASQPLAQAAASNQLSPAKPGVAPAEPVELDSATLASPASEAPADAQNVADEARAPATDTPSTLREETRLIAQAIAALGQDDRATARKRLSEHAWRFPHGLLAPERQRANERLRALDQRTEQPRR